MPDTALFFPDGVCRENPLSSSGNRALGDGGDGGESPAAEMARLRVEVLRLRQGAGVAFADCQLALYNLGALPGTDGRRPFDTREAVAALNGAARTLRAMGGAATGALPGPLLGEALDREAARLEAQTGRAAPCLVLEADDLRGCCPHCGGDLGRAVVPVPGSPFGLAPVELCPGCGFRRGAGTEGGDTRDV